jgi:ABC-type bacteriocin/lantibiotic exporter with double-glycine peptidase domain
MIEEYVGENGVGDTLIGPISIPDFQHQGFDSEIQLLDVKYRYPHREKYAISQVSLTVQMGEFLAIVGPSGAGKTTLVDLMIGVLEPESGTISVSGTSPATAVNLWPGAIAYVPQDANIVNGSFKDNVCLGFEASQVDDELVKRILLDVELKEVLSLPGGIHANVGERGNLLSGGQRQRLGIARALFTNPKLLILDESTSALDANTEARLSKYLLSLKGKVTLIVIAHRLSTVRHADRILYLESGQSIGVGTFNQLRLSVPEFDKQAIAMGL